MDLNWTLIIISLIIMEVIAIRLVIKEGKEMIREKKLRKRAKTQQIDFRVGA